MSACRKRKPILIYSESGCRQIRSLSRPRSSAMIATPLITDWNISNTFNSVFPKGLTYMLPPETHFLFQEIKAAFVAGHCISVVLLTQAFIEHYYHLCLQHSPHASVADRGLAVITECLRSHHLEHDIILDRIDALRRIRNPFTHLKDFQHPQTLSQRGIAAQDNPVNLMEQDAKDSLDALFAIFQHTRFKS